MKNEKRRDGHTLFVSTSNHVANPSFIANLSYDTINDFAPITLAVVSPLVMLVHLSLPTANVQELIAYAKANPDKLNLRLDGSGRSAASGRRAIEGEG